MRRVIMAMLAGHHPGTRDRLGSERWMTFVKNHAKAILVCDFFVTVTAKLPNPVCAVIMEIGDRRIVHFNVTEREHLLEASKFCYFVSMGTVWFFGSTRSFSCLPSSSHFPDDEAGKANMS